MKSISILFAGVLMAGLGCVQPTPVSKYDGRFYGCETEDGSQDRDYTSLLILLGDTDRAEVGVGEVQGNALLVSEGQITARSEHRLAVVGSWNLVSQEQGETYILDLFAVEKFDGINYTGSVLIDNHAGFTETCDVFYRPDL